MRQHLLPLVAAEPELLDGLGQPIEGDPGHDLGVGEVPPSAAHLPDPVVGPLPGVLEEGKQLFYGGPAPLRFLHTQALGGVDRRQDLAVDVELKLPRGGVADTHRFRAFVSGQPVELELGEAARASDVVHDLHVGGIAGHGPQQPVAKGARLVDVPADHEGVEGQAGVTQPAEAIVPVANAADRLRQ